MGILEGFLKEKRCDVNYGTIQQHQEVFHRCWKSLFPDVDYSKVRKEAETATNGVLEKYGLLKHTLDRLTFQITGYEMKDGQSVGQLKSKSYWTEKLIESKEFTAAEIQAALWNTAPAATMRDEWIEKGEDHIQAAFNKLYPPPAAAPKKTFAQLIGNEITFEQANLSRRLNKNAETKAASIQALGNTYKGHGPTTNPFSQNGLQGVFHAHVGNGDGLAFQWKGKVLNICGWGKKDGNTTAGTSGYAWTLR